jgi:glucose-1-phosphate cytidylyltransferase
VICLGYKGYVIKEYFAHYFLHESDVTFDFRNANERTVHAHDVEPWRVTLVNTGQDTMTGGRVKRIREFTGGEPFLLTYGDGVSDIDIRALIAFHKAHGKLATISAAQPGGRFGASSLGDDRVLGFQETAGDGGWINAGFFVLDPGSSTHRGGRDRLRKSRWKRLPGRPAGGVYTAASGSRWTPCATRPSWSPLRSGKASGKYGMTRRHQTDPGFWKGKRVF